jgi:transcriptional regulator with XRE-family HTH domain
MRNYNEFTAEHVATQVGINRATLQNYESGFKRIPDYRVEALAAVLQVDAWEIRVVQEALVAA